jgi:hypothetical protein
VLPPAFVSGQAPGNQSNAVAPANQYNTVGPDGVPVNAARLDYLVKTGQSQILDAIMADNGQCKPL